MTEYCDGYVQSCCQPLWRLPMFSLWMRRLWAVNRIASLAQKIADAETCPDPDCHYVHVRNMNKAIGQLQKLLKNTEGTMNMQGAECRQSRADFPALADINEYIDLQRDQSCLDGWFTAAELRKVAEAMDELARRGRNEDVG